MMTGISRFFHILHQLATDDRKQLKVCVFKNNTPIKLFLFTQKIIHLYLSMSSSAWIPLIPWHYTKEGFMYMHNGVSADAEQRCENLCPPFMEKKIKYKLLLSLDPPALLTCWASEQRQFFFRNTDLSASMSPWCAVLAGFHRPVRCRYNTKITLTFEIKNSVLIQWEGHECGPQHTCSANRNYNSN